MLAEGNEDTLKTLRYFASDPRWRIREAVAMALQRLGQVNMGRLIAEMKEWSKGTPLEQRAAVAALCEPKLLGQAKHVKAVLQILDRVTASIEQSGDRKGNDFLALRKGLGYCWSFNGQPTSPWSEAKEARPRCAIAKRVGVRQGMG